jgi:acyl-CoA hydrolase
MATSSRQPITEASLPYDHYIEAKRRMESAAYQMQRCQHDWKFVQRGLIAVPNMVYSPLDGLEFQRGEVYAEEKIRRCDKCGWKQRTVNQSPKNKDAWKDYV